MKLVTFRREAGDESRVGVLQDGRISDLSDVWSESSSTPRSMQELIDLVGSRGLFAAGPAADARLLDPGSVALCAPIPRPIANIICLGRNYGDHAAETARARGQPMDGPTVFTKAITSVIGPHDDIALDTALSKELDWEAELAFIVGRRARHVARHEALDVVFGYMVLNDISARDLQYGHGGQFFLGKSLDTACPTGPCIVTGDEIRDPQQLRLRLTVNGNVKQDATTANMLVTVAEIIETLSAAMTLLPGQIVATGTPAGVGMARKPPEYLQVGDLVEASIDGIGTLRNRVVAASA